ncbi:hypothetical protein LTR10_018212 [Elasticomyces elasticus]|uniref:Levodione reductase n=1 Tax=Exophiala sideris TaxID=1016849 RepID=A0ABR0J2J1_9EURO|nr:hypothetical protein LTR10_018212 [Elasticomyces elasticus]KAK5024906.1 hypothetical protein LTS07_008284 [Exophiala sideris]KAK5031504.1 hypothetical protein LTR13_007832 [Exophiala sideris]KAK5054945.1 hypothetical protein LTR69_008513 [Exophiala sideris]KAK5179825.1 hypothetical protein LTR44_007641 [Eurotiomycetes sp. CCFEE 6388]
MAFLHGQVIAVTGGASGIGLATSKLLAERGAILSIADTNQERLDAALSTFAGEGHIATAVDVRFSSQVNAWIETTVKKLGKLNGAVNLAGVLQKPRPLAEVSDEDWDVTIDTNAKGVFFCMRAQVKHLEDGGSIVNATSGAGLTGVATSSVYSASKHAVIGLTKSAAKEVGDRSIRINCVAPGVIATPMVKTVEKQLGHDLATKQQALDRQADPIEVAKVIAFLLSDEASFVTGSTYNGHCIPLTLEDEVD